MPIYIHMYVRVSKGTARHGGGRGREGKRKVREGCIYVCSLEERRGEGRRGEGR